MPTESAEKSATPTPFKSYLANKCLVGYGLFNGIINGAIAYAMHMGTPDKTYGLGDVLPDFALTGILLGIILMACVIPLTRSDARKGTVDLASADAKSMLPMPTNVVAAAAVVGLGAAVVMTGIGALASLVLPMPVGLVGFTIFKGVMCAVGGATAGYLSIDYVARKAA